MTSLIGLTFLFGLLWGSFTNVLIQRLPYGRSVVFPGSACLGCHHPLPFYDNIPVISYLLLQGRCRFCQKIISFQYPLVEILVGLLFAFTVFKWGWRPSFLIRDWPFLIACTAISFIDLKHKIIPDIFSLGGIITGILTSSFFSPLGWKNSIQGAFLGFMGFYLLAVLYEWRTKKSGLGGGDVKLLGMLGAYLGKEGVWATVFISSILGTLTGLAWALLLKKKDIMHFAIPFGPFLVIGALVYYFFQEELWIIFQNTLFL